MDIAFRKEMQCKIFKEEYVSKKNKCHNEKIEGQDIKQPLFKVC